MITVTGEIVFLIMSMLFIKFSFYIINYLHCLLYEYFAYNTLTHTHTYYLDHIVPLNIRIYSILSIFSLFRKRSHLMHAYFYLMWNFHTSNAYIALSSFEPLIRILFYFPRFLLQVNWNIIIAYGNLVPTDRKELLQ